MADISNDKDLNPFLNDLESADLKENNSWDNLENPIDENVNKELSPGSIDDFSPASRKLLLNSGVSKRSGRANLIFAIGLLILLIGWVGKAKFDQIKLNIDENIETVTANTIELYKPENIDVNLDFVIPDKNKIEVAPVKPDETSYYLYLDACIFEGCISRYRNILNQAGLPFESSSRSGNFDLISVASARYYFPDEVAGYITKVRATLQNDINVNFSTNYNGKGLISIGFFTTIKKAKENKQILEALAKENGQPIEFEIRRVKSTHKTTYVYSGPFADLKTAQNVRQELSFTTPIKESSITQKLR